MMTTSMYPGDSHALFYNNSHGQAFDPRKLQGVVKSEPMEDVTMTDRPVDMSMPARMDLSPTHTKNSSPGVSISPRHRLMPASESSSLNADISASATSHHYYPASGHYMHSSSHHQQNSNNSLSPHHHSSLTHSHHRPRSSTVGSGSVHLSSTKYSPGLMPQGPSSESRASTPPTFVRTVSPNMSNSNGSYNVKSNDGKLTVPSVLKNDDGGQMFRNVDLLPVLSHQRAKREFVPEDKKDQGYWCKRIKNNDSARRSRMKRKALEKMMESRLLELQKENIELRHEMQALKRRFGIAQDDSGCSSGSGASKESSPCDMSDNENSGDNSRDRDNHSSNSSDSGKDRPTPRIVQEDMEAQGSGSSDDSRYHDDSRVYGGLPQLLEPTARDRADSIGSSSSSLGSSSAGPSPGGVPSRSASGRNRLTPDSRGCHPGSNLHLAAAMHMDKSGALDLTSDHSNRSTPARDSSSPESCGSQSGGSSSVGSCASDRRFSCLSSDSSSQEESSGNTSSSGASTEMKTAFPLKCRWKKCVQSSNNSKTNDI